MITIYAPQQLQNDPGALFGEIPHYTDEKEFEKAVRRVYSAMAFCELAPRNYRDTFLESACAWYQAEVWKKDLNTKNFLRLSQELCRGTLPELEALYMTQLRRLLCAMVIDSQPLIFQDDLLTAVKRMKKDQMRQYR